MAAAAESITRMAGRPGTVLGELTNEEFLRAQAWLTALSQEEREHVLLALLYCKGHGWSETLNTVVEREVERRLREREPYPWEQ